MCPPLPDSSYPQLDPASSPTGAGEQEEQPRLFDEFNDDDDDDGYGYGGGGGGGAGGKRDGIKVVLVAPDRSPVMPPAPSGAALCCGGGSTTKTPAAATEGDGVAGAAIEGGDGGDATAKRPVPVLAEGWAGAGAGGRRWQGRGDAADARLEEEAYARRRAGATAAPEDGEGDTSSRRISAGDSGTEVGTLWPLVALHAVGFLVARYAFRVSASSGFGLIDT